MEDANASPVPDSPSPPGPTAPPRWRHVKAREGARRRRAIVVVSLLAAATVAALILTVGWLRPVHRPTLILLGDQGGASIPFEEVERRALAESGIFLPDSGTTSIERGIKTLGADQTTGTLIVHLMVMAWVEPSAGESGRALVRFSKDGQLPGPGRSGTGATLDDLVAALGANCASRQLLILDIHPPPADPRIGGGPGDVGDEVTEEARRAVNNNPRLSILTSCVADQRPESSEAMGRSVFGLFVELGLKGAADSSGDGRVSVRELSTFVGRQVDRWASSIFGTRQTPRLYEGEQGDFPLALAGRRPPRPPKLAEEVPAYPGWLLEGWRRRDAGRDAGDDREAPRAFGQIEAALLLAERAWRDKDDEPRIRAELAASLERLRERIAATRAIPHPRPRSLALEASFGASPDPDALKAVREVVAKRPARGPETKPAEVEAADARLIAEFASSARLRSDFDLADAVFRVAAEDQSPSREATDFLDRLLRSRQPRPIYAETNALHRLVGPPSTTWSTRASRLALELTRRGEALQARPSALFGASRPLDDADRLRHEAEALLASPGYATPEEVDRRLNQALVATDAAAAAASTIEEARRLVDQAMGRLPAALPLCDLDDLERPWFAAFESAGRLADLLALTTGEGDVRPLAPVAERSETLRGWLAPFSPEAVARRGGRFTRQGVSLGPPDLREIQALLATPLPLAEQRAALWKVGIDLERRLTEATLAPSDAGGATDPVAGTGFDPAEGREPGPKSRRDLAMDALLALAGARSVDWSGLLVSPLLDSPMLDDPATNPARLRRIEEFSRLRRWLADRYAFEARDPDRSEFFAEATLDFAGPGDRPRPSLAIEAEPGSASLDPDHPEVTVRLGLRAEAPSGMVRVEVATLDDDWLDVRLGASASKATPRIDVPLRSGEVNVPLRIALRPESDSTRGPIPPGVLVRVRRDGRTYHRRIPLRIEPESKRPRLIFAAGPTASSGVRLRVAQGKTPSSISIQNPGDRDRAFVVGLSDRRGAGAGASATVTVKAGDTSRVVFGPPDSNPEAGFVDIRGPITIHLADVADSNFRIARTIPVGLAPPSDLVQVVSARYDPPGATPGAKTRLEFHIRAVGPIEGQPCPVELSLPFDRIPGLISIGEGTFREKLEKPGDEVVLFAEDFELDPRADETGFVHLAVDGVERAIVYRARFSRRGDPTIPVRDASPAVRLKAGRVASSTAPLKVDVDVDSPPEDGKLKLSLGQYTSNGPGDRFRADSEATEDASRARIRLNPRGPGGSLLFEATVRDSSKQFEVGKVRGRRIIRALLEDERGDVRASDELPLVLDDRAPSAVAFDSPPRHGLRGGAVTLKATGRVPDSGIKEVFFFSGRPLDEKRPAGVSVVPGKPVGAGRDTWMAVLPLVEARLGPMDVSVEFVPGVGPSRFDTATITVVETIPIEPGSIRGAIKEGERAQPGFEVRVYDEKGSPKGRAITDESGRFEVANLPPGDYEVVSAKQTPPTRGTTKVTVRAGATSSVDVPMFRVLTNRPGP